MPRILVVISSVVFLSVFYYQTETRFIFERIQPAAKVGKYHASLRNTMATAPAGKPVARSANLPVASLESNTALPPSGNGQDASAKRFLFSTDTPPPAEPRRPNIYPIPKRFDLGHIEGKGIGYDMGYTKLSVIFAPEYRVGHYLSLLDFRGVVFDDGKFAANAGYIGRYLPHSFCEVFGFNLFYDYREGQHGNFNQVSGGFEVLNRRWELRANASVPVGKRRHTKTCVFDDYIGPFREVCHQFERADYVVDGNVGYYMVNGKNFQLYAAAGPYCLWGQFNKTAVGGKALLRPQFGDVASVELSVSHDDIFKTIYQVNVVLTLPLYKLSSRLKTKKGPCGTNNRQIYQPIDRDIVLLKRTCSHNNF